MLSVDELAERVRQELPDALVEVTTDGYAYHFRVVTPSFEGFRSVRRQQMVYAGLTDLISSGALHALTIEALAPAELDPS